MELTKWEKQAFGKMIERDWSISGDVHCVVVGCFNPVTNRVGWDDHLFDDAHLCAKHFNMFHQYYAQHKYRQYREQKELALPPDRDEDKFYEWPEEN